MRDSATAIISQPLRPVGLPCVPAANPVRQFAVPRHIIPDTGELRVREVRSADEAVSVLEGQVHADAAAFLDPVPVQERVVDQVDLPPAFGIAAGDAVPPPGRPPRRLHLRHL